jgi:uncharacterized protein (UPF0332 family)
MELKQKQRLLEASNRLRAAERDYRYEDYESASSRAYFSMFHAASALLEARGASAKTHTGVMYQFGQHWIQTGEAPQDLGSTLRVARQRQVQSDYRPASSISADDARDSIRGAERMLELALERIADPHYRQLYEDYAQQVAAVEGGEPFDRLVAERALQDGCDRDEAIRILARSLHAPKDRPSAREWAIGLLQQRQQDRDIALER